MTASPDTLPRTYRGAAGAAGPLVFLRGTHRVALGEWVTLAHAAASPPGAGR